MTDAGERRQASNYGGGGSVCRFKKWPWFSAFSRSPFVSGLRPIGRQMGGSMCCHCRGDGLLVKRLDRSSRYLEKNPSEGRFPGRRSNQGQAHWRSLLERQLACNESESQTHKSNQCSISRSAQPSWAGCARTPAGGFRQRQKSIRHAPRRLTSCIFAFRNRTDNDGVSRLCRKASGR